MDPQNTGADSTPGEQVIEVIGEKKSSGGTKKKYIVGGVTLGLMVALTWFFGSPYLLKTSVVGTATLDVNAGPEVIHGVGGVSDIQVSLNPGTHTSITTVETVITYPADMIELSRTNTNSVFNKVFVDKQDNTNGKIRYSVSAPPTGNGQLIPIISFRATAKKTGTAKISIEGPTSSVLLHDPSNPNVLSAGDSVVLTIVGNSSNSNTNSGNGNINSGNSNTNGGPNGNNNGSVNGNTNSSNGNTNSRTNGNTNSGNSNTNGGPNGNNNGSVNGNTNSSNGNTNSRPNGNTNSGNSNTNGGPNGNNNGSVNGNTNSSNGNTNSRNGNANSTNSNNNGINNGNSNSGNGNSNTGIHITNISPASGQVGAAVTLTGSGFNTSVGSNTVTFQCNNLSATVANLSGTGTQNNATLSFSAPAIGGTLPVACSVRVSNQRGLSNDVTFTLTSSGNGGGGGGGGTLGHYACQQNACVFLNTPGTNSCATAADCMGNNANQNGTSSGVSGNRAPEFSNHKPSPFSVGNTTNPVISFDIADPDGDNIDRGSIKVTVDGKAVTPVLNSTNEKTISVSYQLTGSLATQPNWLGIEQAYAQSVSRRVYVQLQASDSRSPAATGSMDYWFIIGNDEAQTSLCPTPANLSATTTGSQVTFNWTPGASSSVSGYRLHIGTSPDNVTRTENLGLISNFTLTGLTPSQQYYFVLTAIGECSESDYSNMIGVQIGAAQVTGDFHPTSQNPAVPINFHSAAPLPGRLPGTGPEMLVLLPLAVLSSILVKRKLRK